jgi:putative DNA primase/helicase
MAEAAMMVEASSRRFHPVRDWLATLKWDGIHTLDNWLTLAFGCPKDDYHAAVGAKALIAAVRRVRQPGCKFDCMLILEGDQGIGKSTACRTLFSDEWYSDYIVEDLGSKDAALALDGVWGLELAEIQQLIRNEVETVRSFLSRGKDHFRPPYGKSYVDRPRQGVLIGTTNADDYLRDTHGNRRFWPAKCRHADVKWIAEMRSQLWAEAAHREAQGETIFLPPNQITLAATAIQSDRMTDDVWTETVREWLFGRTEVRLPDILTSALNIPRERQGKREEMRVSAILRLDGWERHIGRTDGNAGKATRVWRPKGAATLV